MEGYPNIIAPFVVVFLVLVSFNSKINELEAMLEPFNERIKRLEAMLVPPSLPVQAADMLIVATKGYSSQVVVASTRLAVNSALASSYDIATLRQNIEKLLVFREQIYIIRTDEGAHHSTFKGESSYLYFRGHGLDIVLYSWN